MKLPTKQELEAWANKEHPLHVGDEWIKVSRAQYSRHKQELWLEGAQHIIDLITSGKPDGWIAAGFFFHTQGGDGKYSIWAQEPNINVPAVRIIKLEKKDE